MFNEEEVTYVVQRNSTGPIQIAQHSGDYSGCSLYSPDAVIEEVCNKDIARCIKSDGLRKMQASAGCRATISAVAGRAVAGHRRDHMSDGIHPPDNVVDVIRYKEIASAVHGHSVGIVQAGAGGRTIVARVARPASASRGGDYMSDSVDSPDAVVA